MELNRLYLRYCSIKTKALGGAKISKKEAMEALRLKKILKKKGLFENKEGNDEKK